MNLHRAVFFGSLCFPVLWISSRHVRLNAMNRRIFLATLAAMATGTLPYASRALAAPPEATPGKTVITGQGKEIYVSLRKQRLWSYLNGEEVTTFLISSGEEKRGTKTGNFRVQSKYPEAWSDIWQLRMPYWMGIYDVGRVENGIHAMPLLKNGRLVRWPVGYPASFGCVVANTSEAASLYRWATLGTPVFIRW